MNLQVYVTSKSLFLNSKVVFLPGGINISSAVWPLQRNKAVFDPDVHHFRPKRCSTSPTSAALPT